jgi:hypothetical protein
VNKILIVVLLLAALAGAQEPVPVLPLVYVNTTWSPPTGGTTWRAHTSADFSKALNSSLPGDIIVLDAGSVYTGNFTLPAKANSSKKWIYIESSALSRLPVAGSRIDPKYVPSMPKIVTPNVSPAISPAPGSDHWRLVGLEVTSASNQGCFPSNTPPVNCFSYFTIGWQSVLGQALPDSITIDRCYVHGSPTQDIRQGVQANGTNFAVIDSYISDIHKSVDDSQAILAYLTPGPLKIVDNYLSATTEDLLLGGAGDYNNPYVPADVEIRGNHFFKPLEWDAPGITLPPNNKWVEKNNLEFKSARRVLVTGNTLENAWKSGQEGYSVVLTVRSSQSGNIAVVDDITIKSNILKNVVSGFNTLEHDDACGAQYGYPNCTNPGEEKRWKIDDNLVLFANPNGLGGTRNWGVAVSPNQTDVVFQHNTLIPYPGTSCDGSIYFESDQSWPWPPPQSYTHNVWLLDNVFCTQPTGDWGGLGAAALNYYMGDPAPLAPRFYGNVMYVPSSQKLGAWPLHNYATMVPFTYDAPTIGNYQLLTPYWTDTTDGQVSGISWSILQAATQYVPPGPVRLPPKAPLTHR